MRFERGLVQLLVLALVLVGCGAPEPAPTPPPGAILVTAAGESFTTPTVSAPNGSQIAIYFQITDSSQHDLHLWNGDVSVAATEIFGGPSARTLEVPALAPGEYRLTCDIHPSMHAVLEVH